MLEMTPRVGFVINLARDTDRADPNILGTLQFTWLGTSFTCPYQKLRKLRKV
jgi:hypothetical protein